MLDRIRTCGLPERPHCPGYASQSCLWFHRPELEVDTLFVALTGAALDWPAFRLWQGASGLNRLGRLAGSRHVQVCSSFKAFAAGVRL